MHIVYINNLNENKKKKILNVKEQKKKKTKNQRLGTQSIVNVK